jgi:Tfp pilus assembly protein PilZ
MSHVKDTLRYSLWIRFLTPKSLFFDTNKVFEVSHERRFLRESIAISSK